MADSAREIRMWVMHCPFRKDGTPVLGTFGATERVVVILTVEAWKRLCLEIPALVDREFEVGSWE